MVSYKYDGSWHSTPKKDSGITSYTSGKTGKKTTYTTTTTTKKKKKTSAPKQSYPTLPTKVDEYGQGISSAYTKAEEINKTSGATMSASTPGMKADTQIAKLKQVGIDIMGGASAALQGQSLAAAPKSEVGGTAYYATLLGSMLPIGKPTAAVKGTQAGIISKTVSGGAGISSYIATNTATLKITTTWLTRLAKFATKPKVIVTAILGTIGSYPFAGFIKEEALQTLGFGTKTAISNNDLAGAEEALALQDEILNPDLWDQIKASVPYVNILDQLDKFYQAAKAKTAIDKKLVSDLKIQQETGETADQKWERVRQEQNDMDQANIDYYNEQRRQMVLWEQEAAAQKREQDAQFWAKEAEKQRKLEEEDRKAIADFWQAYRERAAELAEDNRPSNLKFGLL